MSAEPITAASAGRSARAFAAAIVRLRLVIIAIWAVGTGLGLNAMGAITYDPDVLVYFDRSGEERRDFEAIAERFGRANEVVTLVVPADGTVYDPPALRAMARVAIAASQRPEVRVVRSILSAAPDAPPPQALLPLADGALSALGERLAAAVAAAPEDYGPLVAQDGRLAVVAAILDEPADNVSVQRLADIHAALKVQVAAASPGVTLLQTGRLVIDDAFLTEGRDDVNTFVGPQFVILLVLLFAALGSIALTLMMGALVFAVIGAILGLLAASGVEINGISSAAPAVLMGLVVASAIHVVLAWQEALGEGASKVDALAAAFERNAWPVTISIATTMISFLLLNIAESPPFRQLGNIVAVGLVLILAVAFTLMPALLSLMPESRGTHRAVFARAMGRMGRAIVGRERAFLLGTVAVALASIAGAASITIDDTFSHYFDERYEVRRATDLFEETLSGTTIVDLAVDTGAEGAAWSAPVRERLGAVEAWTAARPEVARTASLASLAQRQPGPATPQALAGVHEAAVAAGIPRLVSEDGRHARLSIVLRGVSSRDTLAFSQDLTDRARALFGEDRVIVTGMPILSARLSLDSARAMFVGMGLALALISALLVVTLRSVRLGLVSLFPNLLPVTIAFGLWGAFAGEVSFAATVVGALTYGIVVDDTVHILVKYERFRRRVGLAVADAMDAAFRSVGVAVVVTSVALGLSFVPFAFSGFLVNRHFGALTALTLMAALIADLLLLPAILSTVERLRRRA